MSKCKNTQTPNSYAQVLTGELLVLLDELVEADCVLLPDGQVVQHALHLRRELRPALALQLCGECVSGGKEGDGRKVRMIIEDNEIARGNPYTEYLRNP